MVRLENKFEPVVFLLLTWMWFLSYGLSGSWRRWGAEVLATICRFALVFLCFIIIWIPIIGQVLYICVIFYNMGAMLLVIIEGYYCGERLQKGESVQDWEFSWDFFKTTASKFTFHSIIVPMICKKDGSENQVVQNAHVDSPQPRIQQQVLQQPQIVQQVQYQQPQQGFVQQQNVKPVYVNPNQQMQYPNNNNQQY